jgi:hypothetical protein
MFLILEVVNKEVANLEIFTLEVINLKPTKQVVVNLHQQKIIPSGRNASMRVGAVRQRHQRNSGGRLLCAWRQYHASSCISPSHRSFTFSSLSVSRQF